MFNGRRRRRADKVNDVKYTTNGANYIQTEQTFYPVSTTRVPTSGSPNLQCWNLGWISCLERLDYILSLQENNSYIKSKP